MNYNKYAEKTKKKIAQYGGKCTIIRKGEEEVYDPSTDSYSNTDVRIEGKAILNNYDVSAVNGTSVLAGDVNLMCTFDEEIKNGDTVSFGGKNYTVINVNPLSPDGSVVIYYDVQAR